MIPAQSARLGLALSGGGFRASFFHLGVLRRLGELDLLRHVTTLSTVSGGSILAAHYYLAFRRVFEERKGDLEAKDYQEIVTRVEKEFIRGTAADLRNQLLMNPLAHIAALVTGGGYGRWMARLYTKHFFRDVTKEIFDGSHLAGSSTYAGKGIPLHHAITRLPELAGRNGDATAPRLPNTSSGYPGNVMAAGNLTEFNERERLPPIPHFVIKAPPPHTGRPFPIILN